MIVRDDGSSYHLENGRISAQVDKKKATIISLKRGDQELIRGGTGYWSLSGGSENGRIQAFPKATDTRIVRNDGKIAEVAVDCTYTGDAGSWPINASFRYTLLEGAEALHIYGIFEHPAGMPGFSIGEARFALKPDARVFDSFTVDTERSRVMPSGRDWDQADPLNMKEVRRLTTGIHKGQAEHKYGYSALLSESPAYGWSSSKMKIGLWMVNPSLEYIAGGPTKPELTGHLDVNPGGRPVLLNMWHGSHYGGTSLNVAEDETWEKVIGPFLLLTNEGDDALGMWRKAMQTAAVEAEKWPYAWVTEPIFAVFDRVSVSGKINIKDALATGESGTMWVGLTSPEYEIHSRRRVESVSWQRDGKNYQYWTKAAADGTFHIDHVRPGDYELHAFADGVLGEFKKEAITVEADQSLNLGALEWHVERSGPTVWEIGIPDRDAAEFRNGDRYWQWGHYLNFNEDFPDGVDYTVGKSHWREDWNLFQPLRLDENGKVLGDSTWKVRFELKEPGEHLLRIALCGHREGNRLSAFINGKFVGKTGRLHENGVMHRDGHRGMLTEFDFPVPSDTLTKGENTLELRLSGRVWHQGLLYDYLRLERVVPSITAKDRPKDPDAR